MNDKGDMTHGSVTGEPIYSSISNITITAPPDHQGVGEGNNAVSYAASGSPITESRKLLKSADGAAPITTVGLVDQNKSIGPTPSSSMDDDTRTTIKSIVQNNVHMSHNSQTTNYKSETTILP